MRWLHGHTTTKVWRQPGLIHINCRRGAALAWNRTKVTPHSYTTDHFTFEQQVCGRDQACDRDQREPGPGNPAKPETVAVVTPIGEATARHKQWPMTMGLHGCAKASLMKMLACVNMKLVGVWRHDQLRGNQLVLQPVQCEAQRGCPCMLS